MKKLTLTAYNNIKAFSATLFTLLMLCSFDNFAFNTITTETPLMKIAGIPFYRQEFICTIFALCFAFGTILSVFAGAKILPFVPLCITFTGLVTLFFAVFDADLFQILVPDMRISHVVMTLSQLTAIISGVCGLPLGIILASAVPPSAPAAAIGAATACFLSVLAVQGLYFAVYVTAAIALIAAGIACEFLRPGESFFKITPSDKTVLGQIQCFISIFGLVFILLACYNLITVTQAAGTQTYAVCACAGTILFTLSPRLIGGRRPAQTAVFCAAFALSAAACVVMSSALTAAAICLSALALGAHGRQSARLTSAAAVAIAAICAMVCAHCLADVTAFSGNRVIYYTDGRIFAPLAAVLALRFVLSLSERVSVKQNEKNYDNIATFK